MKTKALEGIADALKRSKPTNDYSDEWRQWQEDMLGIARVLKEHNKYFSYEKFYLQCGIDPLKLKITDVSE